MVLLAVLVLAGCGEGQGDGPGGRADRQRAEEGGSAITMKSRTYDPGELAGGRWVLSSLDGRPLVEGTKITLNFRQDALRGNAGCNSYGSDKLRTEGGRFRVGPVAMTMIGCKGPVGEQESAYLKALQTPGTYRLDGDRLEVRDGSGETKLLFEKEAQ